jgi:hypothetical protein
MLDEETFRNSVPGSRPSPGGSVSSIRLRVLSVTSKLQSTLVVMMGRIVDR